MSDDNDDNVTLNNNNNESDSRSDNGDILDNYDDTITDPLIITWKKVVEEPK
jgi:hypothetical protein